MDSILDGPYPSLTAASYIRVVVWFELYWLSFNIQFCQTSSCYVVCYGLCTLKLNH